MKKFFTFIAVFLFFTYSIFGNNNDSLKTEIKKYINKEMNAAKVTGLSIGIVAGDELIYADGFGFADKENKIPATSKTIYMVGSISKLFTATAIMQLVEQGLIDLDEPVQKYIPDFAIKSRFGDIKKITIRSLLTHHSGIPSDIFKGFFTKNPEPFQTIIRDLNEEYTCHPPLYNFAYSNAGFSLLGCIIEQISKTSFYEYTEKAIFKKLQMENSGFQLKPEMKKLYAMGYEKSKPFDEPAIRDVPAGLLHSNVEDLANFVNMVFNNGNYKGEQILKSETLKEMLRPQLPDLPANGSFNIGLSWFVKELGKDYSCAGRLAEHGGDTYVYHAEMIAFPDEKIAVIVLTNSSKGTSLVRKVAKKTVQLSFKYLKNMECPLKEKTPANIKFIKPDSDELTPYAGDYAMSGTLMRIKAKKHKLTTRMNGVKINFLANNYGRFTPQVSLLGGVIKKSIKSQQLDFYGMQDHVLIYGYNGKDSIGIGINIEQPKIPAKWQNQVGNYEMADPEKSMPLFDNVKLKVKDGYLVLSATIMKESNGEFLMIPINENEAIIPGIGRNTGNTIFIKNNDLFFAGIRFTKTK